MSPTQQQLETYLDELQADKKTTRVNLAACSKSQSQELLTLANRPPAGMTLCKFGSRSVVGKYQLSDGTDTVLKYYYPRTLIKKINYAITGSRCTLSWNAAKAFQFIGLSTPSPLVIEEKSSCAGLMLDQSFLACGLARGKSLADTVAEVGNNLQRLDLIAKQLKQAFTIMARYRVSHGDLKSSNIFVEPKTSKINFIDLDAAHIASPKKVWLKAQKRDKKIFANNWKKLPHTAKAFRDVFSEALNTSDLP